MALKLATKKEKTANIIDWGILWGGLDVVYIVFYYSYCAEYKPMLKKYYKEYEEEECVDTC